MKTCCYCKTLQPLNNFHNSSRSKDGKQNRCKECSAELSKSYRERHPEYARQYVEQNKAKRKAYERMYYEANKPKYLERMKIQRIERPHIERSWKERYKLENAEKLNEYHRKWKVAKRKSDPCFKIKDNTSRRIRYELNTLLDNQKTKNTIDYIGCSIERLKIHLESQFDIGMSWQNYGKWHIDHIIPCAYWNLESETQKYLCFNYRNVQPLWSLTNQSKKARVCWYRVLYYKTLMATLI